MHAYDNYYYFYNLCDYFARLLLMYCVLCYIEFLFYQYYNKINQWYSHLICPEIISLH